MRTTATRQRRVTFGQSVGGCTTLNYCFKRAHSNGARMQGRTVQTLLAPTRSRPTLGPFYSPGQQVANSSFPVPPPSWKASMGVPNANGLPSQITISLLLLKPRIFSTFVDTNPKASFSPSPANLAAQLASRARSWIRASSVGANHELLAVAPTFCGAGSHLRPSAAVMAYKTPASLRMLAGLLVRGGPTNTSLDVQVAGPSR